MKHYTLKNRVKKRVKNTKTKLDKVGSDMSKWFKKGLKRIFNTVKWPFKKLGILKSSKKRNY